jgi:hypothetical protein
MIRHRLVRPEQPFTVRIVLGSFELLASSALATILITFSVIVLAWATWVESLLGVNVMAAALIRYPWRREQIGFLIVHAGILVLLVGCWVSRERGIHGAVGILEGMRTSEIQLFEQQFELTTATLGEENGRETVSIPFRPGPFNWSDYDALPRFPWRFAHRDRGVIYDKDGVRLEVLDYCSDSRRVIVPRLRLRAEMSGRRDRGESEDLTLAVQPRRKPAMQHRTLFQGARERLAGGPFVTFCLAGSEVETAAFREALPQTPLGRLGQIVLYAKGKTHRFAVEQLQGEGPVALSDTGLRIELQQFDPLSLCVLLRVYSKGETQPSGTLVLNAVKVEEDFRSPNCEVYGGYWFAPPKDAAKSDSTDKDPASPDSKEESVKGGLRDTQVPEPMAREAAAPRIDIIQGCDEHLYYRTSMGGRVEKVERLSEDGTPVGLFDGEPFALDASVRDFIASAKPGHRVIPVPFDKDRERHRRAKVRLTVGSESGEFWLADESAEDRDEQMAVMRDGDRVAGVRLAYRWLDIGFQVALRKFECRFDPGTTQPSYYASTVDFLTNDEESIALKEGEIVSPNRPVQMTDPASGRVFRFFQNGPRRPYVFLPGQPEFDRTIGGRRKADRIYRSSFQVAHDPGRLLKYAGCFMVVCGIVVMYYMKAYLFRRRRIARPRRSS